MFCRRKLKTGFCQLFQFPQINDIISHQTMSKRVKPYQRFFAKNTPKGMSFRGENAVFSGFLGSLINALRTEEHDVRT